MDNAVVTDGALVVCRLLLAALFALGGLAKFIDQRGSRQGLIDFGVPVWAAAPFGFLLPASELAVAGALLLAITAWWGAVGALILLCLFVGVLAVNLARGRRPDCRCFGQINAAPIGWGTLVRNVGLGAVATFLVWHGREPTPSIFGWARNFTGLEQILLGIGIVGLSLAASMAWLSIQLLRQHGRIMLRLDSLEARVAAPSGQGTPQQGLPVGTPAPQFRLPGLHKEQLTLEALQASGRPILLVFVDPGCGPCAALMPEIGRWQREHIAALTIVLISSGALEANRVKTAEHGLTPVLLQRGNEIADAYHAPGTPSAVLVRADGTIGSPVVVGADAIRRLVTQLVKPPARLLPNAPLPALTVNGHDTDSTSAQQQARSTLAVIGEPAPVTKLQGQGGKMIDLAEFRGEETLLLFWNADCGFCQQMLPDLLAWEANPPAGAPKLLVISSGKAQPDRNLGFHSPVALDPDFTVGRAFGANGTPMAILIDAEGKIASELVTGASAVLDLAGSQPRTALAAKDQGAPGREMASSEQLVGIR